jgi:hypothetical protein
VVPKNKKKQKLCLTTLRLLWRKQKKNLKFLREPKVLKQKMVAWNLEHALLGNGFYTAYFLSKTHGWKKGERVAPRG